MRYSIKAILIVVAISACVIAILNLARNFDGPVAMVVVSNRHDVELTDDLALELSKAAFDQLDFNVIRPMPVLGDPNHREFVGRNAIDSDRITTIWEIADERYPTYTVRLKRTERGIVASIYANWL